MCVIIQRQPNVDIPFDKIASACIVNPDGWGFAIADRGKLELRHGLSEHTDPDEIMKILEDAKQLPLMLHLRFSTIGKRIIENCHPFWSLTKDKHGIDLAFCHNGTLSDWKEDDSDLSDSYWLNQKLITPLFERTSALTGKENILRDEFSIGLLEHIAGWTSLFGLIDSTGTQLAINGEKGKAFEGWWASNEYSFNERHRTPKTTQSSTTSNCNWPMGTWPDEYYDPWEDYPKSNTQKLVKVFAYVNGEPKFLYYDEQTGKLVKEEIAKAEEQTKDQTFIEDTDEEIAELAELVDQGQDIKKVFDMHEKKMNPNLIKHCMERKTPAFVDICKIDDLREVTRLDPEDIAELVSFYPEAATVLINNLLYELYFKSLLGQKSAAAQAAAESLADRKNKAA